MTNQERLRAFDRWCKYWGLPRPHGVERAALDDLEDRGALEDPARVVPVKGRREE